MGIEFTKAYVANGKTYATLEEAQRAELAGLFALNANQTPWNERGIADIILSNAALVMNILTITDSSRPKARGVKKPRKPKANVTPQPEAQAAA